jgi:mannose-6-phosphate isomerase-like protein (cupin superfamily)
MMREAKVWGERWLIRKDSTHAVSFLKLKARTRCSWHKHREKYNLFVVLWGKVGIRCEQIDGSVSETILTHGDSFTTKPGQAHEFVAYESSGMIEEMYVEYSEEDIQRTDQGGKLQ